jgi:hypothetical protein
VLCRIMYLSWNCRFLQCAGGSSNYGCICFKSSQLQMTETPNSSWLSQIENFMGNLIVKLGLKKTPGDQTIPMGFSSLLVVLLSLCWHYIYILHLKRRTPGLRTQSAISLHPIGPSLNITCVEVGNADCLGFSQMPSSVAEWSQTCNKSILLA